MSRVIGPANHAGERYALDYAYDPVVATHVTRIADSFGYSSTASHHYNYGKVETTTDLNGEQTTYARARGPSRLRVDDYQKQLDYDASYALT